MCFLIPCTHTRTHMHTHTHIHMHTRTHMHAHTSMHTCTHAHTHAHAHTHMHTCTHTHTHTQFDCCGWTNASDWMNTTYYRSTRRFPDSCNCRINEGSAANDGCQTIGSSDVYSRVRTHTTLSKLLSIVASVIMLCTVWQHNTSVKLDPRSSWAWTIVRYNSWQFWGKPHVTTTLGMKILADFVIFLDWKNYYTWVVWLAPFFACQIFCLHEQTLCTSLFLL